jgi:hypothetical protein
MTRRTITMRKMKNLLTVINLTPITSSGIE